MAQSINEKKHLIVYDAINNDSIVAACIAKKYYSDHNDADGVELMPSTELNLDIITDNYADVVICGAVVDMTIIKVLYSRFITNLIAFDFKFSNISAYKSISSFIRGYRTPERGIALQAYKFFFDNVDVDYNNDVEVDFTNVSSASTVIPLDIILVSAYNSYTNFTFNNLAFADTYKYNKGFESNFAYDVDDIDAYITEVFAGKSTAANFIQSASDSIDADKENIILQAKAYNDTKWLVNKQRPSLMLLTHIVLTDDIVSDLKDMCPGISTIVTFTRLIDKSWVLRLYKVTLDYIVSETTYSEDEGEKTIEKTYTEEEVKEIVDKYLEYNETLKEYMIKRKKGTLTDDDVTNYTYAKAQLTDENVKLWDKLKNLYDSNAFNCEEYLRKTFQALGADSYAFAEISEKQFISMLKSRAL